MDHFFALCLAEHYRWGFVLAPYMLETLPGKDYFMVHDLITADNLKQYKNLLTDVQVKIVHWVDQCSEKEMARVLRRKTSVREFLQSLTADTIAQEVRPYIERGCCTVSTCCPRAASASS